MQEEIAASNTDLVLYRECMHSLAFEVFSKASKKIYLVGPASSGKSIALATVVAQMRSIGWLVCPLPRAFVTNMPISTYVERRLHSFK